MRNSSNTGLLLALFGTFLICFLGISLFGKTWMALLQHRLQTQQTSGLPASSTQVTGFSIPTSPGPVSLGREVIVNNLGITATRIISPADAYIGSDALPSVSNEGKEYLVVDITVRCISSDESCRLTEFDFGLETQSGNDYAAEFSTGYSKLKGLFEGGEIDPGNSMSGSLIFIIEKDEKGLILFYPRMFGFGSTAKFNLRK